MNLALCGMMGCGKTTVGKALAEACGKTLVDTDACIVEKHGAITEIFSQHGEPYFRDLETETVKALAKLDGLVIATGGGLTLRAENVALLKENGKVIYLRAKAKTLEQRLQTDQSRPLLQGDKESLKQKIQRLLQERESVYESVADFTVDTDGKTAKEIVFEILSKYGK